MDRKMTREKDLAGRHGDNLYPDHLEVTFGEYELALDVPAGVWNPTPHGMHLGSMLLELDFTGEHVLELGTGCGIHAILIARQGAAKLSLTEIQQSAADNAIYNLKKHDVRIPVDAQVADWVQVSGAPFDAVVSNPPFCKSGKRHRRYFIDTLILEAHKLVKRGGRLVFIQSSMADVPRSLALMEECGMQVRILGETSGPFRDYYFEDKAFLREIARVPGAYTIIDGVHHERLIAFEATLP